MTPGIIARDGLVVRRLQDTPEDVAVMAKWLSDPRVLEFYEGRDNPHDEQKIREEFIEGNAGSEETLCIFEWEGRPVGYVQFYPVVGEDLGNYECEPGPLTYGVDLFIGEPEFWGRSIGTALLRLVLEHLVHGCGAGRVVIDPVVTNARAIRSYEKCGFRKVKVLPRHEFAEGRWTDNWLMIYEPNQ
ncbi:MAG: family N-acetyltransferase [Symbiobacteriaceae bacterium]|nr:family N-acetyltransferase [Symbiobacteriaceae bacterium]